VHACVRTIISKPLVTTARKGEFRNSAASRKEDIMSINVKNGTPMHGPSLCETCTRAHIARGYRESQVLVICGYTSPEHRVTFSVSECSSYVDKNRQTLYEMDKIAWTVAPRDPKRATGFVAPGGSIEDGCEIELILDNDGHG
jgi:hypothetical protein